MSPCNSCQDITFNPLDEGSADRFGAIIHSNVASLQRRAESRECHLCVALYGMIIHQKITSEKEASISLAIQYKIESDDDWGFDFIDEEVGLNDGDAPDYLLVQHSDVQNMHFRIHNPMAISRSSLQLEQEEPLADDDIELTNPTLSTVCHDTSTGSDASMALMRSWITMCEESHQSCRKRPYEPPSAYPTRLLDISSVDSDVGLVLLVPSAEANLDIKRPSYATLSHRWRPGHTCSTFSSDEREYARSGIPTSFLTKTFHEACITVKSLGLKYLWIDSLCIIQDSPDDKEREIPKMADYYQNADFNIAASTERDGGDGGLWQERDGEATRPFNLPITINTPTFLRKTRKVTLRVSPILQADRSHLDSRGWILQERIFPRRTLFFDPYWVSFECAEMSASESCPQGILKDLNTKRDRLETAMATAISREPGLSSMGGLLRARHGEVSSGKLLDEEARNDLFKIWFTVVSEYCNRDLTHTSDRLDAISALAGRLSQLFGDDYIAGIWKSNLLKCLWWDVSTSCGFARATECGAPTWSLASVCRRDVLPDDPDGRYLSFAPLLPIKHLVQILDLSWRIRGSNRHGNISGAKLTVSGNLLRGYAYRGGEEAANCCKDLVTMTGRLKNRPAKKQNPSLYEGVSGWLLRICAEAGGQRDTVTLPIQSDTYDGLVEGFVYLLPLAESIGPIDFEEGSTVPDVPGGRVFGLVLKGVGDETFERLGCAEMNEGFLMSTEDQVIVIE